MADRQRLRVLGDGAGAVRDDAGHKAPYVCLAAWPGGHDNPHWTRYDQNIVHFLDTDLTALQLTTPKYRSLTKASKAASELLLTDLGDDARYYRRVAFRLQGSVAESLRDVFVST